MITGLFARANHPIGWGRSGETAHGYSVLAIECNDKDQLKEVEEKLRGPWRFHGLPKSTYPEGWLGYWFGGQFDLIGIVHDATQICNDDNAGNKFNTYGDNRFFGVYKADEVLQNIEKEE